MWKNQKNKNLQANSVCSWENNMEENNSNDVKVQKVDLQEIEILKDKEDFFDYTNKLLDDQLLLKECKEYLKNLEKNPEE